MIDAALLRAVRSDRTEAPAASAAEKREACAFALAALRAGEAVMDGDRFARVLSRLEGLRTVRRTG